VLKGSSVSFLSCLQEDGLRFAIEVGPEVQNLAGNLHGGAIATLVDVLTTWALIVFDKQMRNSVSTNLSIDYVSGAGLGSDLIADARVLKAGRTLAFLEMEIRNRDDMSLIARGSHTKFMTAPLGLVQKKEEGGEQKAKL